MKTDGPDGCFYIENLVLWVRENAFEFQYRKNAPQWCASLSSSPFFLDNLAFEAGQI